jgi:sec-independent protein translocase protein TatA
MFRGLFDGPGIWIVLVAVVLLFGATRLPALARSIGQSTKILRDEMKTDKKADPSAGDTTPMVATEPTAPVVAPVAPAAPAAADPAAPTKSVKSPKAATGKSGKSAKS